jgi:hypothetical protein
MQVSTLPEKRSLDGSDWRFQFLLRRMNFPPWLRIDLPPTGL